MKQDNVSLVARKDEVILIYSGALVNKHGTEKVNLVSQHMRDLARLLIEVRKLCELPSLQLKDAIKPELFDNFAEATKNVSGFDENESNH